MDYPNPIKTGAFALITSQRNSPAKIRSNNAVMEREYEAVHVHCLDEQGVIDQYRAKGYVLEKRTRPTIIAQGGFVKLIFARAQAAEKPKNGKVYLG
jgi:hypothetical protein